MTQIEDSSQPVYSFARGENEQIRLELRPYKGRFYIDLRLWFQNTPHSPFSPTTKGISFSSDHLEELNEGVKRLNAACLNLNPGLAKADESPQNRAKPVQNSAPRRQTQTWPNRSHSKPFN